MSRAVGTATVDDRTVAGLHGRTPVAFVRADSARTTVRPRDPIRTRLPLQLAKDHILMREKILD